MLTAESIAISGLRWQTRVAPDGEVEVVVGFSAPGSLNEETEVERMWLGRRGVRLGGLLFSNASNIIVSHAAVNELLISGPVSRIWQGGDVSCDSLRGVELPSVSC